MNPGRQRRKFRFASFELDLTAGELTKGGTRLRLGEPFRVTSFGSPGLMIQNFTEFSVARDQLLLLVTEVTGNISMLENVDR